MAECLIFGKLLTPFNQCGPISNLKTNSLQSDNFKCMNDHQKSWVNTIYYIGTFAMNCLLFVILMNQRGLNCFFCYTFIDVNYQKSIVCKSWHGVESRRSNRKTNTTLCDKEWGREPGRAMLTKIWNKSAKSHHWSDSGPNFRSSWFCCFWNLIFSVISNFNKSKDLWSLTCMVPFIPGSHVIAATKIIWPPSSQSVWVVSN